MASCNDQSFRFIERSGRFKNPKADVQRFMNRLLAFPLECQSDLFELYVRLVSNEVKKATQEGKYKGKNCDMPGTSKVVETELIVDLGNDDKVNICCLEIDRGLSWAAALAKRSTETKLLEDEFKRNKTGEADYTLKFYVRKEPILGQSIVQPCLVMLPSKAPRDSEYVKVKCWKPNVPMSQPTYVELKKWYKPVQDDKFVEKLWNEWYKRCAKSCAHFGGCEAGEKCTFGKRVEHRYVLTGAVFPIWNMVDGLDHGVIVKPDGTSVKVVTNVIRVNVLDDQEVSSRLVGLELPQGSVDMVRDFFKNLIPGSVKTAFSSRDPAAKVKPEILKLLQSSIAELQAEKNVAQTPVHTSGENIRNFGQRSRSLSSVSTSGGDVETRSTACCHHDDDDVEDERTKKTGLDSDSDDDFE
jgi:hypothetical protein